MKSNGRDASDAAPVATGATERSVSAMAREAPPDAGLPLAELLRRFAVDFGMLVRQELTLARYELLEKGKGAARPIGLFAFAALLGLGAFAALTVSLIAALAFVLQLWAAALAVTLGYGLIALLAALAGKRALSQAAPPNLEQTLASVKADVEAVRAGVRKAR